MILALVAIHALAPAADNPVSAAPPAQIESCALTPPDMLGPYYIEGAPEDRPLYPPEIEGPRLLVYGTVYAEDCETPLPGALVEVWQADFNGDYYFDDEYTGRGAVLTDENGYYEFVTIVPGEYEPRPMHIHYRITHPSGFELVTQLYFVGRFDGVIAESQLGTLEDFDREAYDEARAEAAAGEAVDGEVVEGDEDAEAEDVNAESDAEMDALDPLETVEFEVEWNIVLSVAPEAAGVE